jgi:ubiquinone biosynthesis protein
MPHINIRDLGRLRAITSVLAKHGFGHLVRQAGLEIEGEPIETSLPFGRRLRLVLIDLGPTYVKLGQVLSVRPDIVPKDVMEELATLQSDVPPVPFDELRTQLELDLGGQFSTIFQVFDEIPIASASIAQVHRAVLADGTDVAVKVQRPGIEEKIKSDLHILYTLAQLVTGRIEIPGLYTPVGIVQEFEAAIYTELDFLQEARSLTRFREHFAAVPGIHAPLVYPEWSSRRVLVMELLKGRPFRELKGQPQAAVTDGMRKLIEATYLQVFEHGFFHADPHPGNLLILEDGRLAYLDFGLTGRLTAEMQDILVNLFLGLVYRDAESVALTLYRAGATDGRVDLKGFKREIERLMLKYYGATLDELSDPASLIEIVQVAARFRIRLVPEYAVLARATSILDGIARELMPDKDIIEEVRPYAQRLMGDRLSPDRLSGDAVRLLQHAQLALRDIPIQMNQLLLDLERGNLTINAVDPDRELLRDEIGHAGVRIAMAVLASALLLSGTLLIGPYAFNPWGVPVLALLGFFVVAVAFGLFGALLGHYLFATRIHPREWKRRAVAILRFFIGERAA